jgi:hypothetical protein
MRYILKGIAPKYAAEFAIIAKPQGFIQGKRVGVSQNLSRAARRGAGWGLGSNVVALPVKDRPQTGSTVLAGSPAQNAANDPSVQKIGSQDAA